MQESTYNSHYSHFNIILVESYGPNIKEHFKTMFLQFSSQGDSNPRPLEHQPSAGTATGKPGVSSFYKSVSFTHRDSRLGGRRCRSC